jgi:hypothetical protein
MIIKSCYDDFGKKIQLKIQPKFMKLELLTNAATVVDNAIRFVNERTTTKKDRCRGGGRLIVTETEESETTTSAAASFIAKNQVF